MFDWNAEKYPERRLPKSRQIGLIVQEVERVFPELVNTDDNGYKAVFYDKLVPVLVEAMKEQQAIHKKEMEAQQKEIKEKNARIERLERALENIERRLASIEDPSQKVALR